MKTPAYFLAVPALLFWAGYALHPDHPFRLVAALAFSIAFLAVMVGPLFRGRS